jgi:hypothetical protein
MADFRHSDLTSDPRKNRSRTVVLVAVVGAIVVLILGWRLVGKQRTPAGPSAAPISSAEAPAGEVDLQVLIGKWQRPDGGYVLDIRTVAEDGAVEAAYFNPNPINVSAAKASSWRGTATVFVEFDDVNYRGSTYELVHDPEQNILRGTYYQAALDQIFEVVFVPVP